MNTNTYLDIDYILGSETISATDIGNLGAIFEEYKMPNIPSLWGLDRLHVNSLSSDFFISSAFDEFLEKSERSKIDSIDYIIFCSSRTLSFDLVSKAILEKLSIFGKKSCANALFLSQLDCTNFMVAVDLAKTLILSGARRVLIIGAESGFVDNHRISKYAAFSDFVGILSVSNSPESKFLLHESGSFVNFDDMGKETIDSFDAANEKNFQSFTASKDVTYDSIKKIYPLNIYVPLLSVKYRKIGFDESRVYTDSVSKRGHCWGMDPFISLAEDTLRHDSGVTLLKDNNLLLLNSQASGRSAITTVIQNF